SRSGQDTPTGKSGVGESSSVSPAKSEARRNSATRGPKTHPGPYSNRPMGSGLGALGATAIKPGASLRAPGFDRALDRARSGISEMIGRADLTVQPSRVMIRSTSE